MKVSLILPYWDRQEAADKALGLLWQTYAPMFKAGELEVVLVDDGSNFIWPTRAGFINMKVVRLPVKSVPMSPCVAWNAGVKEACGDMVVLSCVEVLHENPVIQELVERAKALGPDGYALGATWCPESESWHCHSTVEVPGLPEGVGIGFCGAMSKSLYLKAGGFDEEYREGAGYEDRDFIQRLLKVGAKFRVCDDLVVTHPKTGASIQWPSGGFERNLKLYVSKWPSQAYTTFVCVQSGNYCGRGSEYVNTLFDMVGRNLPNGTQARFFCLTDDPKGLDEYIGHLPLPDDLEGWYGKLYLFKRGLFTDGLRVVYLDLDTVIVGNCRALVDYKGEFATLRDFYQDRLGPAVILWRAGDLSASIWDEWVSQGSPKNELGDLWWINNLDQGRFARRIDKLQDLYPGQFVSYKKDCNPHPPQGARVVCFHGLPRPHEVQGWVSGVWKKGGLTSSSLELVCNTEISTIAENIRHACSLDIPWLTSQPANDDMGAVLVAGGPSLADDIGKIRERAKESVIIAMNGTADYLADHGITSDYQVIIDARERNRTFLERGSANHLLLASQCHPSLFDMGPVTAFHIALNDWDKFIPDGREATAIGGGHSVGLYAMSIAYTLGFRSLHLYGYDSSYRDGEHHSYTQAGNDNDPIIEAHVNGKTFKTTNWMVVQVNEFQALANQLRQMGCEITTHGDGLLPWVAWNMMALAKAA